jgi:urease subunit beta
VRPGEVILAEESIACNRGRTPTTVSVENTSDHTVQVTSHYHFFEANRRLRFDRRAAYGRRLDIPAGSAVHWDASQVRDVALIAYGGRRRVHGFQGLVNGALTEEGAAVALARQRGFLDSGG